MKIGLLGGSFDPFHCGHLLPVREARRACGLDRVIYLPTADPPHKPRRRFAPAWARFAMVEIGLLDEEGLFASSFELTPGREAYTVDSVEHFRSLHPGARIHLLLGADSFLDLPSWRRWRDIARQAELVVMVRPGWEPRRGELPAALAALASGPGVHFVENRPVAASATEIRRLLSRGERPPEGWMPEAVLHYCRKYRLYR